MMDSKAIMNIIPEVERRLAPILSPGTSSARPTDVPHPSPTVFARPLSMRLLLFPNLQNFLGRGTKTRADLDHHIQQPIGTRPKQFWMDGIRILDERWQQPIDLEVNTSSSSTNFQCVIEK